MEYAIRPPDTELDELYRTRNLLLRDLEKHPTLLYYIATTHLRKGIDRMIYQMSHPEEVESLFLNDFEMGINKNEHITQYISYLEHFTETNKFAKRLGLKGTLEKIGLVCDLITSNTSFSGEELEFFGQNDLKFYESFLNSIVQH